MEAAVRLEREARDAVRRAGIDPFTHPESVRALVEQVCAGYEDDAMRGVAVPLPDPEAVVTDVMDAIAGFGLNIVVAGGPGRQPGQSLRPPLKP